jgi:membrane fusion protein, multidrug efflux system
VRLRFWPQVILSPINFENAHMSSLRIPPILALSAIALVLGLTTACGEKKTGEESPAPVGRTLAANLYTVQKAAMTQRIEVPGTVASEDQVQVASRLMGYIRKIKVQEGQSVKAGQLLFVVDPADIQGQVNQARAGLAQAEAALADAQSDYDRFGALYKEEAIPKVQWDKVRLQHQIAQQQVAAAKAGLGTASSQMRYASVTAPIAGVVTQKMANPGDLASPGRPVVVIEGLKKLQVTTSVGDDVFAQIKPGDKVSVNPDGGSAAEEGIVALVVPAADPVSHTHLVKIDLPRASGLESGHFVRVGFHVGSREGIHIPVSAVVERAGITGVFVIDANGIAHFRMVRVGSADEGVVEIQAGLNPGEQIAVSQTVQLENGDKVSGDSHE